MINDNYDDYYHSDYYYYYYYYYGIMTVNNECGQYQYA